MKIMTAVLTFMGIASLGAPAHAASELKLLDKCKAKIEKRILREIDEETASIAGIKLLYGGSKGGLNHSAVVIVRTSEESEPRDFLVVTDWVNSAYVRKSGCKILSVITVADGSLPEVDGLE